jgi:hypothetical protein
MGQSLVKNYIHLIFSTKHRRPLIQPFVEEELHARQSFQDEYRAFLKKYNVEYDESYVWD